MRRHREMETIVLCGALAAGAAGGCRGQASPEPPIHLNPNMVQQERFEAQERNDFFADHRAMRPEVPGTVPAGARDHDEHLVRGRVAGEPARTLPLALDETLLRRGRARYEVFCSPCHDAAGTGDGVVVRHGMVPPPSFDEPRLRAYAVGQIFVAISEGERNMPSYAAQIPVEDRWAIAAYVRALQVSRRARIEDVPPDVAASRGWRR
jgi:mono/diheme cytochrome c family protein